MRGAGQQAVMLALLALLMACSSGSESPLYRPSGAPAWIPPAQTPFADYVRENEARIRQALASHHYADSPEPFGPGYPLERAVAMRAPYELRNAQAQCPPGAERPGFLLIHGLTDSPYLLRGVAESLLQAFPCALLRAVLLPGHGTVPGDTLDMRHEDWLRVTEYGVESFRGEVDGLYLVGFSTGTSLSVRYADAHRDDTLLRGLLMLSPALAARSESAWLSPYARWFTPWLGRDAERDAARYESFSMNAGAEFYLLTRGLSDSDFAPLPLPVFMAGSGDDTTVNMEVAREFFCSKTPTASRRMLWYSAEVAGSAPAATCEGLQVVAAEALEQRVLSLSHTAISVPPTDPHYGLDGAFALCGHFRGADYDTCRHDATATVYGERNLGEGGRFEGRLVRRGSFNPHYDAMLAEMVCFIEGDC
jgi:esterase/lipase